MHILAQCIEVAGKSLGKNYQQCQLFFNEPKIWIKIYYRLFHINSFNITFSNNSSDVTNSNSFVSNHTSSFLSLSRKVENRSLMLEKT